MTDGNKVRDVLIIWLFLLVLLSAGCASLRTRNMQASFLKEQAQIAQRLQEIILAAEMKDFTRLDSYHLYGPKFSRFSESSPARLDAAETRTAEHNGLASLNGLKMRVDSLKIDVFGNVAIATFILDETFELNGQSGHRADRSTIVFVKDHGDWKIAHEHFSKITSPEENLPGVVAPPIPSAPAKNSATGAPSQ